MVYVQIVRANRLNRQAYRNRLSFSIMSVVAKIFLIAKHISEVVGRAGIFYLFAIPESQGAMISTKTKGFPRIFRKNNWIPMKGVRNFHRVICPLTFPTGACMKCIDAELLIRTRNK